MREPCVNFRLYLAEATQHWGGGGGGSTIFALVSLISIDNFTFVDLRNITLVKLLGGGLKRNMERHTQVL